MDINELRQWAKSHDIENRTIDSFKRLLINYELDDPDEYAEVMNGINKENLNYYVHTVSLNLGNWPECSYNTVSASLRIYNGDKQISNYCVHYLFSGEIEDDFVDFF